MYITATIATIATAGIVASAQADTALLSEVKTETAAILADTGTDGVKVAAGAIDAAAIADNAIDAGAIATGAITNAKFAAGAIDASAIATDAIDADAIKADAITEIQAGLATAAALDAVDNFIDTEVAAILADTNELQTDLANGGRLDLLIDSIITHLTDIKGAGWTNETLYTIQGYLLDGFAGETFTSVLDQLTDIKGTGWTNQTLVKIVTDIAAISAGSGATAQEVWEYATRVLTAGTNIDLSALATAANLAALDAKVDTVDDFLDTEVAAILADTNELQTDLTNGGRLDLLIDAIKAKTDNLPADPADDSDIDTAIAAVKSVVDAIKTETDGHPTAAEVWSYGTRTLTNSTTGAVTPAEGDTLEVTKDATIIINFTGLGDISAYDDDTTDEEDKVWFTAKANLDDPDSSAVIQIHTLYPAGTTPPDTLDYINGAAATATEGTFQFTDLVAGNATLTLAAAAAADLPIYAVSPLYWDIKILDYSAGTVSVLASGEMYIYGTPTKSIA